MSNWSNIFNGPILIPTGSVTGSSDGMAMIFAKSDGKIYVKNSSGTESSIGAEESSGVISTTRLGSGNPSSANYLRGDGTWTTPVTSVNGGTGAVSITAGGIGAAASSHTHAASAISSGTIATARLGSGTANSTTYLRGDQTWATVSGGDTTYSLTTADAENTALPVNLLSFLVPGNSWLNGEIIYVDFWYRTTNATATSVTLTTSWEMGGSAVGSSYNQNIPAYTNSFAFARIIFVNDNGIVRWLNQGIDTYYNVILAPSLVSGINYWNLTASGAPPSPAWQSTGPNLVTTLQIRFKAQWSAASDVRWVRILNARAWKPSGQVT